MPGKYKHLTGDQRRVILETYQQTLDVAAAATAAAATRDQARRLLKRSGSRLSGCRNGACYRHLESVRRWAGEGVAVSEIARRIGTTSSRVSAFLRKHSIPRLPFRQTMHNNPAWRGGRVVDKDGYILVKSPNHPHADRHGYVREHRLVMERVLGRHLLPTEVVHHRNRDKRDNRPENLRVYHSNGEHLADELAGRCPQWSTEGRDRLRATARRQRGFDRQGEASPHIATPTVSEPDGSG